MEETSLDRLSPDEKRLVQNFRKADHLHRDCISEFAETAAKRSHYTIDGMDILPANVVPLKVG